MALTHAAPGRVGTSDEQFGRFFATFNLVGDRDGTLNVYIRLRKSKHYEIYERRWFKSSAEAGRFLKGLEPSAMMFVVDPFFE